MFFRNKEDPNDITLLERRIMDIPYQTNRLRIEKNQIEILKMKNYDLTLKKLELLRENTWDKNLCDEIIKEVHNFKINTLMEW